MPYEKLLWRCALFLSLALVCLHMHPDRGASTGPSARIQRLAAHTLWVWERREDLRGIDTSNTAIAWLDQTIFLGPQTYSQPRLHPFFYPEGVERIAVVRIEVQPNARLDAAQLDETVGYLLHSAGQPGIAALQVDFDAKRSERPFYAQLLADLRHKMPENLPLSITALASWCSNDDWISGLPVDEAVPMFFRMEPDRAPVADLPQFRIREPLCSGSIGISTHEVWPGNIRGKRIYIFADLGWQQDLSLLKIRKLP